jgi:isopentenyl-diphosphate delta-isomerase
VSEIARRKASHLAICTEADVEARGSTLLEEVTLLHEALPELSLDQVDLGVDFLGRRLSAPILISGMSGGAEVARDLNRCLARAAQAHGFAMGLGSQRAMLDDAFRAETYHVRELAPDIPLLANLGVVQARDAGPKAVESLVREVEADALCLHLNAAQELVQDEGDRDFRGCLAAIAEIVAEGSITVMVKETGCGMAPATLGRLREAGVKWVDVAGAGGTTWTGVEALRGSPRQRARGQALREWGIPTAASLLYARRRGLRTIASGGIRHGGDVVRALVLGADLVGMALPFLRAFARGGRDALAEEATALTESLRAMMLLTGAESVEALRDVPRVIGGTLQSWIEADSAARFPSPTNPLPSGL